MASWDHEGVVELFRSDPRLAAELLRAPLGLELLAVTAAERERILDTKELEILKLWVRRAATVSSTEALFE